MALLKKGMQRPCTREDYQDCVAQFGEGKELEWACKNCEYNKGEMTLHPYTEKLLNNRMLRLAGYPLRRNDLTVEEWLDLGRIEQCLATRA